MNCLSIRLPEKSWILYNVMLEPGAQYIYEAPGVFAVQYLGKPLWLYAEDGVSGDDLRIFLNRISGAPGLVASKYAADLCPWPYVKAWELAAFYLPGPFAYNFTASASRLVFPAESDIPVISEWIRDFYKEALDTDIQDAVGTARALITSGNLYCLELLGTETSEPEGIVAMGMLIPLPHNLCRLNLIYTPYRAKGFGKAITAAIVQQAQNRGQRPVLYARVDNDAAMATYRSLGFIEAGRLTELRV